MTSVISDEDKIINKIISEPCVVTAVRDGWIFSFSAETLETLLQSALDSGKVIVFVRKEEVRYDA